MFALYLQEKEREHEGAEEQMETNEEGDGEERAAVGTSHHEDADAGEDDGEMEEEKEAVDFDLQVRCPLFRISPTSCDWCGTLGSLENHVRETHDDIIRKDSNVVCNSLRDNALIILHDEEMFLYYKCIKENGMFYATVLQVGLTSKDYKYIIKLLSVENTIGRITFRFGMHKIKDETFENVFNSGRCMAIEKTILTPYIRHDKINMIVRIEKIISCDVGEEEYDDDDEEEEEEEEEEEDEYEDEDEDETE
jgi:hypothetical protein